MKHTRILGLITVALLTFLGCQYDPWAHGYLTTTPSEKDIVGNYKPDSASRKRSIKLPMSGAVLPIETSATIVLAEDHSAQFIRVPADFQGSKPCTITGKGAWSIGQSSGRYYAVYVRIKNDETNSPCRDFNWPLLLYGEKPPYKLHEVIDDPDLGEAVQFEKRQ